MTLAAPAPSSPQARRTLAVCGGAHALHDGFTDILNALWPLLQAQFGLAYAAIGALRGLYSAFFALGQIPAGSLATRIGAARVLAGGTLLAALGFAIAGLTGSLVGVAIGLAVAGLGGACQHPLSSSLVAAAYAGPRSRTALGTYNFSGDLGKAVLPASFALLAAAVGWQTGLVAVAILGVLGAGAILALVPATPLDRPLERDEVGAGGSDKPWAFRLLVAIHVADDLVRSGFLIFLPFLLRDKGADLPTIGLGLSLVFAGGAAGKLACGWLGARFGVVRTVILTETATTLLILALLPSSLPLSLVLLPAVGLMLNGTSSVLYGTVPEFVTAERRTKAFAIFYTSGSLTGMVGPLLFGTLGDFTGVATAVSVVAAVALLTVPLVLFLRPALRP